MSTQIEIIKCNTTLRQLNGTASEIQDITSKLNLNTNIIVKSHTNWILHVDIELSIILEGSPENIEEFKKIKDW